MNRHFGYNYIDQQKEAEHRVRERGYEPTQLFNKWRSNPPEHYDEQEAVDAILDILTHEGIIAWDGDAVRCVAQMIEAQYKRWKKEIEKCHT